jgi:hypothetical protein
MLRAGLALFLALTCAGCADNTPPPPAPACPPAQPGTQDCAEQPGLTVHMGGTVSYGMGIR